MFPGNSSRSRCADFARPWSRRSPRCRAPPPCATWRSAMFTGLVEETGRVLKLHREGSGARLIVAAEKIAPTAQLGESIAINGCCLTVAKCDGGTIAFDLLDETLRCTNLGAL